MFGKDYIKEYKRNISLAYPVVLGQAGHMFTQLADNIMVGKLGSTSLAAAALANVAFTILLVSCLGLTSAVTTMVGNQKGANNHKGISELLSVSLISTLVFASVLAVLAIYSTHILHYLGQEVDVVLLAIPYFNILCFSIIPLSLFFVLKHFVDGMEFTKPGMVVSIVGNLLNIVLNYILIYGKWGMPEMGLNGAGWATFIARIFMFLFLIVLIARHAKLKPYLDGIKSFSWRNEWLTRLMGLGVPIALQYLLEAGAFMVGGLMVGWLGAKALAAHQIALSIASFTFMMAGGLGATATIRVSNLVGAKRYDELKLVSKSIFILVIVFMCVMAVVFLLLNEQIAQLFINELDVVLIAAQLLIVASVFQLFDGIQVVAISALRGFSDVKIPTLIALFSYWLVSLPIGYYFVTQTEWGALGVWFGFLSGLGLAAILLTYRFFKLINKHNLKAN